MESLSGSGHTFAASRLRLGDKLELFRLDPWGMHPELLFSYLGSGVLLFMRDSYASRVLSMALASVCVCVSVRYTLQPYQNGAS